MIPLKTLFSYRTHKQIIALLIPMLLHDGMNVSASNVPIELFQAGGYTVA